MLRIKGPRLHHRGRVLPGSCRQFAASYTRPLKRKLGEDFVVCSRSVVVLVVLQGHQVVYLSHSHDGNIKTTHKNSHNAGKPHGKFSLWFRECQVRPGFDFVIVWAFLRSPVLISRFYLLSG